MMTRILLTFFTIVTFLVSGYAQVPQQNYRLLKLKHRMHHPTLTPSIFRGGGCVPAPYSAGDPAYDQVIAADSYCCDAEWDAICQQEYDVYAGNCAPSPYPTTDSIYMQVVLDNQQCCTEWSSECQQSYNNMSGFGNCVTSPYPTTDPIYQQVVSSDLSCCNNAWDNICQTAYNDLAGIFVPGQSCDVAITAVEGTNTASGPSLGLGCNMCVQGANANWFVYTPSSSGTVSISSCGQGVNTNVWIYSGFGCGDLNLIASNDDFCEISSGPGAALTASYVEFGVCAGNSYYIEWDDSWSSDGFDFIITLTNTGTTEMELAAARLTEYTHMPLGSSNIGSTFDFYNIGLIDITNVQSELMIKKNGVNFFTETEVEASTFVACTQDNFSISNTITETGNFEATVRIFGNETETSVTNNSVSQSFVVDTTFARDNNNSTGSLSLGQEGEIGTLYTLLSPNILTSLSLFVGVNPVPGTELNLKIYSANQGSVTGFLGTGAPYTLQSSDENTWITVPISGGPMNLPAGEFFVSSVEEGNNINIPVGTSESIYTPLKLLVNIPNMTAGFEPIEVYEPVDYTLMLRANFGVDFTSIPEEYLDNNFKLVPNPSNGIFYVTSSKEKIQRISVIDATGKVIKDVHNTGTQNYSMDLTGFANGIYTVRVVAGEKIQNIKLVFTAQ